MWIAIGLAMLAASVWLIMRTKPDRNGHQPAFAAKEWMGSAIALVVTTLFAFGVTMTIYGIVQL